MDLTQILLTLLIITIGVSTGIIGYFVRDKFKSLEKTDDELRKDIDRLRDKVIKNRERLIVYNGILKSSEEEK